MKTPIWPRLTGLSGQYRSGAAPQPAVTPELQKSSIQSAAKPSGQATSAKIPAQCGGT